MSDKDTENFEAEVIRVIRQNRPISNDTKKRILDAIAASLPSNALEIPADENIDSQPAPE